MFDLTGKRALVTGATQGIGLAIARLLAEQGAVVFVNGASSEEKCRAVCGDIPGAVPVRADITDPAEREILYAATGDVDILILNASVQYKRPWDGFSDEEYDRQFDCNVRSSYELMKHYAPAMQRQHWGRIVAIGSVNQKKNHPTLSLYGVTKAALLKMCEGAARALAPDGVTVNNVAPGAVSTPRNTDALSDPAGRREVESKIPAGRVATPQDIAPAVLFLCSEEASYITGSELFVDGGLHL